MFMEMYHEKLDTCTYILVYIILLHFPLCFRYTRAYVRTGSYAPATLRAQSFAIFVILTIKINVLYWIEVVDLIVSFVLIL